MANKCVNITGAKLIYFILSGIKPKQYTYAYLLLTALYAGALEILLCTIVDSAAVGPNGIIYDMANRPAHVLDKVPH